jgi:hypothetical protein
MSLELNKILRLRNFIVIFIASKIHGITAATKRLFHFKICQVPDYREVVGCIRDTETGLGFFIFKLKGAINK